MYLSKVLLFVYNLVYFACPIYLFIYLFIFIGPIIYKVSKFYILKQINPKRAGLFGPISQPEGADSAT